MQTMKYNREEILKLLRDNRAKHREIFLEAQNGYRKMAVQMLEDRLEKARTGKHFNINLFLEEPVDQTRDYDRAIRMLEMANDSVIELTERDFAQYVMDDWQWKREFLTKNAAYSLMAMAQSEDK